MQSAFHCFVAVPADSLMRSAFQVIRNTGVVPLPQYRETKIEKECTVEFNFTATFSCNDTFFEICKNLHFGSIF